MMTKVAAVGSLFAVLLVLSGISAPGWAAVGPGDNDFEIDADYGSTVEANGDVSDDGHRATYESDGSGRPWQHYTETAYMGLQCYKVRCTASPDSSDQSEQVIMNQLRPVDGVRYYSLAFCIPDATPTPTDFLQLLCRWWQDYIHEPPLQLGWGSNSHLYVARVTETDGWEFLYDGGHVVRNRWYHFLFAVRFGQFNRGALTIYQMDPASGLWEVVYSNPALELGWDAPADTTNYSWKVGTYRESTPETTRVYYDNVRYARLWSIATKQYLTGYHKNVMLLPFNEPSVRVTQDYSDYDNDGTLVSDPVWRLDGVSGSCLQFDGVDDYIKILADPVDFDLGNYMTASGWFKTTNSQIGKAILCMDEYSTTYKFRLYLISDTEVEFAVRHPDGTVEYLTGAAPSSLFDSQWHHIAATYNRWASDGLRMKLYCDGTLVGSAVGQDKPLLRGENYLFVGRFSGEYFRGCIDDPALYNYAMTDAEIAEVFAQYASSVKPQVPEAQGLLRLSVSPNPCGSHTVLAYDLDRAQHVSLAVYDVTGREYVRLVDEARPRGRSTTAWDGRDRYGNRVPPGIYLLRLQTEDRDNVRKLTVLR